MPVRRAIVAKFGTNEQKQSLLYDIDATVRKTLAKYGDEALQLSLLEREIDLIVLVSLAEFGVKSVQEKLVGSVHTLVRCTLAEYGDDDIRQMLIDDACPDVRVVVARYGNELQREYLQHDKHSYVAKIAHSKSFRKVA